MADPAKLILDGGLLSDSTLQEWVAGQRWFASKARHVAELEVVEIFVVREQSPLLALALVQARFTTGTHELYQVPLGVRPAAEGWSERVIADDGEWTIYDGLVDPELARALLRMIDGSETIETGEGHFSFTRSNGALGLGDEVPVRLVGVEQSNSSLVFGNELILKAFRKLEPGMNPELELLRFLSGHGFPNIAPLYGWYEYDGRALAATLGILQRFFPDGRDGWELALAEMDEPEPFFERLAALGEVTGAMHTALGSDASDPGFSPDEPSQEALSLLTATVDEDIERIFLGLPDDERVAPIAGCGQDVRERLATLSQIGVGGRVIRTHGDYHLGQTLYTPRGWVVLDFEGEPARPLFERRQKRSPLRDVAGMLRSFAYAASATQILHDQPAPEGWEDRARESFLAAYLAAVDPSLLPPGEAATENLLSVFELEKAVYELRYELNNRPEWVPIPVAGIRRLLELT